MLKIGSAYKIKKRDIDAFFTDLQYRSLTQIGDNYIDEIFTVIGLPKDLNKNNWYCHYHKYIVLFRGERSLYLFRPETQTGRNPFMFLEEIVDDK